MVRRRTVVSLLVLVSVATLAVIVVSNWAWLTTPFLTPVYVRIISPSDNSTVTERSITIGGTATANSTVTLTVNGERTLSTHTDWGGVFQFDDISLRRG